MNNTVVCELQVVSCIETLNNGKVMIFLNSQSLQSAGTEMGCFACKASGLCLHVLSGWHNWLCKVVNKMYIGLCRQRYTIHLSCQRSSNSILCRLIQLQICDLLYSHNITSETASRVCW